MLSTTINRILHRIKTLNWSLISVDYERILYYEPEFDKSEICKELSESEFEKITRELKKDLGD